MSFGRVLRDIRTENEDSLRKLAEKTDINFTKINKIELGDIAIAEDTLNKFIEVYPLYKNKLVEAYIKDKLPKKVYNMFINGENKTKIIYDAIFKELEISEQKEILNSIYEKLVYLSVKRNKFEERRRKLMEIKRAIDEL